MSDDSISPSEYASRRQAYAEKYGYPRANQAIKRLEQAVLDSEDAVKLVQAAAVELAKEQSGLTVDPVPRMVDTTEAGSITVTVAATFDPEVLEGLDLEQMPGRVYMHVLDSSHNDGSRFRTKGGAFATGFHKDYLVFYRSFDAEEMDELGVTLVWDVLEDVDAEPNEQ